MILRMGTRASALATAQARGVAEALTAATGVTVELVEVVTEGDRSQAPVAELGVGVFVSALRDALLAKEIDFAVHSYKDLPTAAVDELQVAAVPRRADPRDVLVSRDGRRLAELPAGARVGTGSPRRIAQLHALGRGLVPVPLRGNVDTRLRKVASGELDAVVLARAGLARLGREDEITETLDPEVMLPAPAQGALAVECRADDPAVAELLAQLDHAATRLEVAAERALLTTLEAGCRAPVAALARAAGDGAGELELWGAVFHPQDGRAIRRRHTVTLSDDRAAAVAAAGQLGRDLAEELLAAGARTILESST